MIRTRTDDGPLKLQGFNNLTKCLSFNLYDFFVARDDTERESYLAYVDRHFSAAKLTAALRGIADIIEAEVLSVSDQDYDPHGASSVLLMSDVKHGVAAHLDKSHICAHTYPDQDPGGLCSFRVDIDIATCGTILPLRALDYMFEAFENDVVIVDYVVRGFTRDETGKRIFLDHDVGTIQSFIAPETVSQYRCEDLILESQNIWQTKMIRRELVATDYFPPGADPGTPENQAAMTRIKKEMLGIFHGWPT